jgi:peptidoglycan hydrolase CwlO-like protein
MAGEYDKQFEELGKLIEKSAERTDSRLEELTQVVQKTTGRVDDLVQVVQKTTGRVDELVLEVRDLRKTLLATNDKIDILHTEVTGNLIRESKRITSLDDRVDILEQTPH